jgi:hypothetical protein
LAVVAEEVEAAAAAGWAAAVGSVEDWAEGGWAVVDSAEEDLAADWEVADWVVAGWAVAADWAADWAAAGSVAVGSAEEGEKVAGWAEVDWAVEEGVTAVVAGSAVVDWAVEEDWAVEAAVAGWAVELEEEGWAEADLGLEAAAWAATGWEVAGWAAAEGWAVEGAVAGWAKGWAVASLSVLLPATGSTEREHRRQQNLPAACGAGSHGAGSGRSCAASSRSERWFRHLVQSCHCTSSRASVPRANAMKSSPLPAKRRDESPRGRAPGRRCAHPEDTSV